MTDATLGGFAQHLLANVLATAEAEETTAPESFTLQALEDLEQAGEVDDTFVAYHKAHGIEIHGYGVNDALGSLDLFVSDFTQSPAIEKLNKATADTLFRRALKFLDRREEIREHADESSDVRDMCVGIEKALLEALRIRVFLLSNRVATSAAPGPTTFNDLQVTHELWDLARFERLASSGTMSEPVVVGFDPPLPCLPAPGSGSGVSVMLAIVPGQLLADLYGEYGTRLLELNVRSFLQTRGKVNSGIRATLLNTPELFTAYNNGITATAATVDFVSVPGGGQAISRINGLQIVNGGQTTASIYYAHSNDKADLSPVHVQMKLAVIPQDRLNDLVPMISKYSNSQNAVTQVDFSSNHPYHVEVERITRSLWAPAVDGSGLDTKWFYERARGQYTDGLAQARTPAAKKKFKLVHPTSQKFSKADLAKYLHSWDQRPYWVSRGAQKNFAELMIALDQMESRMEFPLVDRDYCHRLIAKAKLFKEVDKIARVAGAGSIKSFVTTYTVSRLSLATDKRLDLDRIWREQGITPALANAIRDLCPRIMDRLTRSQHGYHVGEWAKKGDCWDSIARMPWTVPSDLAEELRNSPLEDRVRSLDEAETSAPDSDAIQATAVAGQDWLALHRWAKETGTLEPRERQLLGHVARRLQGGLEITPSDVSQVLHIRTLAIAKGFVPDHEANEAFPRGAR
ncbi:AIPR family protein [Actinomadura gamaensis]|uniref:AIPR family protein n=1 Tax=Actinomadura gamaensis TaxID=1763541 RepID=A0ABV9UES8_9ACTN